MKRKLNVKTLLILLGGSSAFVVGTYFLHNFQVRRTATYLLTQADRQEKDGKLDKAAESLERYINFRPKDTDALAHYARVLDKQAKTRQEKVKAAGIFETVARQDPTRVADLRRAAELLTEIGEYRQASPHWINLLKSFPEDGVIEGKLAVGEIGLKRYPEADKLFASAIKHTPKEIGLYVGYADLLRSRMNQPERAVKTMDMLVAANPDDPRAFVERARFRLRVKIIGAEADIAKARGLKPDDIDVALLSSQISYRDGSPSKAIDELSRALAHNPKSQPLYLALGKMQQSEGKNEDALKTYRKGLDALPDSDDLRYIFADTLIQSGKTTEAEAVVADLNARLPNSVLVRYLEACLLFNQKHWSEAVRKFEILVPDVAPSPELEQRVQSYIGLCFDQLAAPEQALAAYRRSSSLAPDWVPGRLRIASSLTALGRIEEAIREYRGLPIDTPGVRVALVRLRLAQNSRLPEALRKWDDIEADVAGADKTGARRIESLGLRGDLLLARGKLPEARALIEKARADFPDQIIPSLALVALLQAETKSDEAFKILEETEAKFGDVPDIRLAKVRYWTALADSPAAKADASKHLASLGTDLTKFSPSEQSALLDSLALANQRLGNRDESSQWLEQSIQRSPEDLRLRLRQLANALESGKDEAVTKVVQELRRIEGDNGIYWRLGEANRLSLLAQREKSTRGLAEARTLLGFVLNRNPDNVDAHRLMGTIDDSERNIDQAIAHYQRAYQGGLQEPYMLNRLALLLLQRGKYVDANRIIAAFEDRGSKNPTEKKLAAEIAIQANDLNRGLARVRSAVDASSPDGNDHLWQAKMLLALAKTAEAEAAAKRAVALLPQSAAARLTLIQALAQAGEKEKAKVAAAEAEQVLSKDNRLELAQIAMTVGNLELASRRFDEALAAHPDDLPLLQEASRFALLTNQSDKATGLYRKILDPSFAAPSAVKADARRGLSQTLLAARRSRTSIEAEALIDQNLAENPRSILDQKLKAIVVAAIPGRGKDAIRAIEKLRDLQPLTSDEGLLFAQVLDADGQWPAARFQALTTLGASPLPYRAAVWYLSRLLKRNELDEANLWLAKLAAVNPKALDFTILKARWLAAKNQGAEAVALIEAKVKETPESATLLAQTLEDLGRYSAAVRILRNSVQAKKLPDSSLYLAEALAFTGQLPEAVELCEAAWSTSNPLRVVATAYAICNSPSGRSDSAARARLIKGVKAAIDKDPKLVALYNMLAQIQLMDLNFSDAEASYRRSMEIAPDDANIMNNLAWMLSMVPGRESDGLAMIQKAIEIMGQEPNFLDTRGLINLALGQVQPAIADFQKSIQGNPHDVATVHFHMARAQLAARQPTQARESLRRAEAIGFKPESLHPVEIPSYNTLRDAVASVK